MATSLEDLNILEELSRQSGFVTEVLQDLETLEGVHGSFQLALVRITGETGGLFSDARAIVRRLAQRWPTIGVALVGPRLDGPDLAALTGHGRIADFIPWPVASRERLAAAIRIAEQRHRLLLSLSSAAPEAGPVGEMLTRRDSELAKLLIAGLTPREIAAHLLLSGRTVQNRISQLYRKLGVTNRAQATARLQGYDMD